MPSAFTILSEKGVSEWYIASIPEVPGAFSQGKTLEEASENALDALAELMAARRDLAIRQCTSDAQIESLPFGSTACQAARLGVL